VLPLLYALQASLAVLVACIMAYLSFLIQLRRLASRQGIASVTGWVAGWVRGGDHSAVVLLLGAAGRTYSTGLVQGPRLAQVGQLLSCMHREFVVTCTVTVTRGCIYTSC
jgi:hypothetical protein